MSTPVRKPKASNGRLIIKQMVMNNFKSYAGEQCVGPFHKSFSAVVGPNGSGKSNVIDAMLFVFGKRAKQMRLNKVSELIHNSTNHQNLNSACVSVYFQEIIDLDDGTYEAVSGRDLVIAREAFKDNSSKYYINGRDSKFTEVTNKLKGKGIDLDNNRFLILQGEVEQISLMKPKSQGSHDEGFLEYLEDIIGTNKYLEHINESQKQLESLNEKRTEVLERVKLADKEKDKLENVKNEAEDYMLKKLFLLKCQEKAMKFALEDNDTKKGDFQMSVSGLEESLASERRKIDESKKELNELEMSHNMYMKRQAELDSQLKRCKDELKEYEKQDDKHQNGLKRVKQKIKDIEEKIVKDSAEIAKVARQFIESANLITKLQEENVKLQQNYVDGDYILEELKKNSKVETEPLRTEIADVHAKLNPWEKQLIAHQGELEDASNKKKDLCEKHEAGRVAYMDARKRLDDIHTRLATKTSSIKDMQTKLEKNIPDMEKARKLNQEKEALLNLEQAARQKVTELKSVIESVRNHGNVLNAILQAKASNSIQGIYGRLGDLGAIDAKYDVAISTACPGLDNILVETTAVANACVDILRRNNVGRGTFIVLEQQVRHMPRLKEKGSTPEGVPRLFDLIKVQDEKLKLAFFQVMGNTVVAKDNDQGKRIAYGVDTAFRRVVTLDGVLFETSGTMSGGGRNPSRGKMGTSIKSTSVSRESVIEAENELTQIVEKLKHAQNQISELVRHHEELEKATSILKTDLSKSQIEIEELNSQHENLAKQLDSLKAEAEPSNDDLRRLEELKNIISEEEKNINKLTQDS
ncbi:structural maintenance of chromosomes protein 4, partial [Tanacetum coccineum]